MVRGGEQCACDAIAIPQFGTWKSPLLYLSTFTDSFYTHTSTIIAMSYAAVASHNSEQLFSPLNQCLTNGSPRGRDASA